MRALACWGIAVAVAMLAGCNGAISPEGVRLLQSSDQAYRRGDDQAAIEAAGRFIDTYPRREESAEAYYIRALALKRLGKMDAAKADLTSAVGLSRDKDLQSRSCLALGEIAYAQGDMPAAEAEYRKVLELSPAAAPPCDQALYRLGSVLQRTGRWREADLCFSRLVNLFEGSDLARRASMRWRATKWSIQAGAFEEVEKARRAEQTLAGAGLAARIDTDLRDGKLVRQIGRAHV